MREPAPAAVKYNRNHVLTGLGLAVSQRIAHDHGGRLRAANRPQGEGACFTLRLPAAGSGT